MSNVSTVTPYDSSSSVEIGELEQAAVERLKAELGRERLMSHSRSGLHARDGQPLRLTSVGIHLSNPETLVRAARKLGYRVEPLAQRRSGGSNDSEILVHGTSGERLAIHRNTEGRLVIHSAGGEQRIQKLVRQHTLDRALAHLESKGMKVQSAMLANGETQIQAVERDTGQRGGAATVKAQVTAGGTVQLDVDCVKGNRCEAIVNELADAVGGQVISTKKKDSYYQLPGEPTRTRQQV